MPLWPGSRIQIGAGLWNSLPGTLLVEGGLFAACVAIYARATRPRTRTGSIAWWSLVALLVAIYIGSVFGPPPPSANAVIAASFASWIFFPWLAWIDRHRPVA